MEASKKVILIYQLESAKKPFLEWLNSLRDKSVSKRIAARLDRLEEGNLGDCRNLSDGISELRLQFGAGYRIYFGLDGEHIVILLNGGDKSSQAADIEKAKQYWADYLRRRHGKE